MPTYAQQCLGQVFIARTLQRTMKIDEYNKVLFTLTWKYEKFSFCLSQPCKKWTIIYYNLA